MKTKSSNVIERQTTQQNYPLIVIASEARQSQPTTVIATPTRHCERNSAILSDYRHCITLPSLRGQRGNPDPTQQAQPRRATMHTTTASHIILAQAPSPRFAPLCIKSLRSMALAGCISLAFLTPATAADFSGSLKGVSITDAQATNKPPTATFTYTQNGDIVTLDASGSSDPDGTISKYKWTFGDGTTSEGATATYTLSGTSKLNVTLTVVDNNNGVALSQQTITPASKGIADDFSANTASSYTSVTGNILTVSGGTATPTRAYTSAAFMYSTDLTSSNMVVRAKLSRTNAAGTGLYFRASANGGYFLTNHYATADRLYLYSVSGSTFSQLATILFTGKMVWPADTSYPMEVTIQGSTITAKIDWNNNGAFDDANGNYTVTDNKITAGTRAGFGAAMNGGTTSIDDFKANPL